MFGRSPGPPRPSVAQALDRITTDDNDLRAFTFVDTDSSRDDRGRAGPLRDVAVGVKDIIDVKGMPTTAASKVLAGSIASEDAPVVARLRAAGAVIVGKTNLDEFAYGVFSPPTKNPWRPEHVPGGSSGGSAAAVAAGMCAAALGTDTAGSIRIPAALCGIAGLKPRHMIDAKGIVPLAPSLDVCGPMARDPEDLVALWQVMSGERTTSALQRFRVGVFGSEGLDLDPAVAPRYEGFVASLHDDDRYELMVKELPELKRWERPGGLVLGREAWRVHTDTGWFPAKSELYSPEVRTNLERASVVDPVKIEDARAEMDGLRREFDRVMHGVDVAVMPTTPSLAPRADEVVGAGRRAWTKRLTRFVAPLNFCDLAAATIPLWGDDDLPWGVDAIAADEWTALDFALAIGSSRTVDS